MGGGVASPGGKRASRRAAHHRCTSVCVCVGVCARARAFGGLGGGGISTPFRPLAPSPPCADGSAGWAAAAACPRMALRSTANKPLPRIPAHTPPHSRTTSALASRVCSHAPTRSSACDHPLVCANPLGECARVCVVHNHRLIGSIEAVEEPGTPMHMVEQAAKGRKTLIRRSRGGEGMLDRERLTAFAHARPRPSGGRGAARTRAALPSAGSR